MTENEKIKSECKPFYDPKDNVYRRLMKLRADPEIRQESKDGNGDVKKNGNTVYSFSYYSDEQATDLAGRMGAKYGLLIIPTERNVTYLDALTSRASVKVSAINVDDHVEQIHVTGYGTGNDNMCEAKALTYAGRRAMCIILGLGTSVADPERPATPSDIKKDFFAKARAMDASVDPPKVPSAKPEVPAAKAEPPKPAPETKTTEAPTRKADIVAPSTTTTATMPQPPTPLQPKPPVATTDSPFKSFPEYRGCLRGHAGKLFAEGRMGEASAREVDAMLRKATTIEDCHKIAQFIQDNDVDREAI